MRSVRKSTRESEESVQRRVVSALLTAGFTVVNKTHGNCYQPGWPDLYAFHPIRGHRWIEVKAKDGSLTGPQRQRFACWAAAGVEIHVLDDSDLAVLYRPANWMEWLTAPQTARYDELRKMYCRNGPTHTPMEVWTY